MVGINFEMPSCCTNSSFEHCPFYDMCRHRETIRANFKPNDCPLVEAIPKADYENRLKADLVAMLEEISLEIDEMDCTIDHDFEGYYTGHVDCQKLIQQKINSLKENKDGENNY